MNGPNRKADGEYLRRWYFSNCWSFVGRFVVVLLLSVSTLLGLMSVSQTHPDQAEEIAQFLEISAPLGIETNVLSIMITIAVAWALTPAFTNFQPLIDEVLNSDE